MNRRNPITKFILMTMLFVGAFPVTSFATTLQEYIRKKVENIKADNYILQEKIHCTETLPKVYVAGAFQLNFDSKFSSARIATLLEKSEEEGLAPKDYHVPEIRKMLATYDELSELDRVHLDIFLTDGTLLFISHMLSGKVSPVKIDPEWHVFVTENDPEQLFLELRDHPSSTDSVYQVILPKHPMYAQLKGTLKKYRRLSENGGWNTIEAPKTLKPGLKDSVIIQLRKRLSVTQNYTFDTVSEPTLFDENLESIVIEFQKHHGLDPDGAVGPATLRALNQPVESRIEQIKVNLERWRWLPREFGSYYISVNIADFTLDVFKDHVPVRHHRVIIGQPARKTPVFSSKMTYLVLNPTWTVPPGIIEKDIIPEMQQGIDIISRKKLNILDQEGNEVDATSVNWKKTGVHTYTFVQDPGPDNALGAVKFMFPNKYQVYLHDTPGRYLFSRSERAFSSGCVRVENPLELAEFLLNNPDKYNLSKLRSIVKTAETQTIVLKEKPEVYILYSTCWINNEGEIQFRNDIYNRDNPVSKALKESEL